MTADQWPLVATPTELAEHIATPRPTWDDFHPPDRYPPIVQPPPLTDKALRGTIHDPRRTDWWLCPNEPRCPHGAVLHDVYDFDDPSPTCCIEGCGCGKPHDSRRFAAAGQPETSG